MQANEAAKSYKSEMGKRTTSELMHLWTGVDKLYDFEGKVCVEVSEAMLEGGWLSCVTLPCLTHTVCAIV